MMGDKEFDHSDYPNYPHLSEDGKMMMTDAFVNKQNKQDNKTAAADPAVNPVTGASDPAVNPVTGQPASQDATQANRDQVTQATGKVQNSDYKNGKVDADPDFETPPPPKDDISTDLATNATNTTEEDNLDNTDGDGDGDGDKDGGKDGGKKKGIIPTRTNTTASTTGSTITPPNLKSGGATPNQTRGLANKNWGLA